MRRPRLSFAGVALVLTLLVIAATALVVVRTIDDRRETAADAARIGGPFALTAAGGRQVTDRDLRGRPFAIFFGYTRCPDVCPTTLAEIDAARDEIGPSSDGLQVVFVSVDPERDSPESLQDFVGSFRHPVLGLTGTPEQVAAITAAYRVFYEKAPGADGDYLINHTAAVYLMDGEGRFTGTISYQEDHAAMVAKLRRLMADSGTQGETH